MPKEYNSSDSDSDSSTDEGNTPLIIAARDGNLNKVISILKNGANKYETNDNELSALELAIENGHLEIVTALIEWNKDRNTINNYGSRPLGNSAIEATPTPLFIAAKMGHTKIVELLLTNGAKINESVEIKIDGNTYYVTPLFVAAQKGHPKIVELLLLQPEANVDKTDFWITDEDEREELELRKPLTPLFIASLNDHSDIVHVLLKNGANQNWQDDDGITPLFIAAEYGYIDTTKTLLDHGADINMARNDDATPLYIATENENYKMVKLLLEHGANVDQHANIWIGHMFVKRTPLFLAIIKSNRVLGQLTNREIIELLLTYGADIYFKDERNISILDSAENKPELKALLLEGYKQNRLQWVSSIYDDKLKLGFGGLDVESRDNFYNFLGGKKRKSIRKFTPLRIRNAQSAPPCSSLRETASLTGEVGVLIVQRCKRKRNSTRRKKNSTRRKKTPQK
jgi:ankyrin repeat protein